MNAHPTRKGLLGLIILGSLLLASSSQAQVSYSVTAIGGLSANEARNFIPTDLNNQGVVAGYYTGSGSEASSLFTWQTGDVITRYNTMGLGLQSGFGYKLNESNQMVGTLYDPDARRNKAVLWNTPNSPVALSETVSNVWTNNPSRVISASQTGYGATGGAINDLGHAAGTVNLWSSTPVIWRDGSPTVQLADVVNPYPGFRAVNAMNNADQVLFDGTALWDNGTLRYIDGMYGNALNERGDVVGRTNGMHAGLWRYGTVIDLGDLPGGQDSSIARDINEAGQVVGNGSAQDGAHAFIWQNGMMSDLNALIDSGLGWTLSSALAINDQGQILGKGLFNGQARSFLLTPMTPMPEASTWGMALSSLAVLLGLRRCQQR